MNAARQPDTEVLLERARTGDQSVGQQLLARHRARLRQMVALRIDRRMAARVDPSDVVQEALADAAQSLSDYFWLTRGRVAARRCWRPSCAIGCGPRWRRSSRATARSWCCATSSSSRPGRLPLCSRSARQPSRQGIAERWSGYGAGWTYRPAEGSRHDQNPGAWIRSQDGGSHADVVPSPEDSAWSIFSSSTGIMAKEARYG